MWGTGSREPVPYAKVGRELVWLWKRSVAADDSRSPAHKTPTAGRELVPHLLAILRDDLGVLSAFVDESYDDRDYHVAALVVTPEALQLLNRAMGEARLCAATSFGISLDAEFHGYEIMSGRAAWKPLRGKYAAASSIYMRALSGIRDSGAKIFIRGVNIPRLNERYRYPNPPHQVSLQHVLEQVDMHAAALGERVRVYADQVPDQDRHANMIRLYSKIGTPGFRTSMLPTIWHPIESRRSCDVPGLQAADLVVYLYRRMFFHAHRDAKALKATRKMWNVISPAVVYKNHWTP